MDYRNMIYKDKNLDIQHPKSYQADQIKNILLMFAAADTRNFFSFSSGHLGALGLSENIFHKLIFTHGLIANIKKVAIFFCEFAIFIIFAVFPIKNAAILLRTFIRYSINPKPKAIWPTTIISLGSQRANKDGYFRPLLNEINREFDYLKIVGGKFFFAKDFTYIESTLGFFRLG